MSENKENNWAKYLDGGIFACLLLTALAAPVSIAATNVGWILGIVLWIVRTAFKPRPTFFRTPVDFAFVGFFAWSLLSSLLSYAPDLSLDRLRVLTLFPIAYLFAQNIGESKRARAVVLLLLVSTMTTVFITYAERITGRGVQILQIKEDGVLARHGIKNGDTIFQVNGREISEPREILYPLFSSQPAKLQVYRPDYYLDIEIKEPITTEVTISPQEALGFDYWQSGRNWRSAGFYGHYATYAEVLQLVMSLVFGLFITLPKKKSYFGAMLLICLVSMGGALLLTATRSSQAAFLLSAFGIVALGANRKIFLTLLALSLPLAVAAAIYVQQSRGTGFVDSTDGSTTWRLTVWREGVELLTKSPRHLLVGVGIDSVKRYKCEWGLFANCTLPAGHFHSTPLQIAVETGLPALFLWLFVVWRYGKALFDTIKRETKTFEKGVLLGAFGGLIGFLASGIFHYNLGDSEVAMVFFLIMGLSLFLIKENRKPAEI
jgi:O-antigen ligase